MQGNTRHTILCRAVALALTLPLSAAALAQQAPAVAQDKQAT